MTYAIIETADANASKGKMVALRVNKAEAIALATKHHKKTGAHVFVASKTNLRRPVFEVGKNAKPKPHGDELAAALLASLNGGKR